MSSSTQLSESPLLHLEPQPIWSHFDGIRRVPRPSRQEERIVQHVRDWARKHGFSVRADGFGNLVVVVPATEGHENAPLVVLQSHLDMVCEKNADSEHDFDNDPIGIEVKGEWVHAQGTTLGADNGLGAAAAMAVAVDPEVVHGPLELLFTLDEETGLNGAAALDGSIVEGRLLLNLDTEEDDAIYIGCAGASGVEATFSLQRSAVAKPEQAPFELAVRGLLGGHSGIEIHLGRGNAIQLAATVLHRTLEAGGAFDLVSFHGGSKANAIPRESFARVLIDPASRQLLEDSMAEVVSLAKAELGKPAAGLEITLEACEGGEGMQAAERDAILRWVLAVPHGVLAMSREVPGLVETSNNLAVLTMDGTEARAFCSFRSSVNASLERTRRSLRALTELAGAGVEVRRSYPGWKPEPDAPLVQRTGAVYRRLFGSPPEVKAVHAGLECGILTEKLPGLEVVSIGPEIRGAHSPDERASIPSVAKFYHWLTALLADLAG